MIAADASVLIGWLDPADADHQSATEALERAAGQPLYAATLTIAEVLVGPAAAGQAPRAQAALRDIGIQEVGLTGHAERLAALRASTGQRLPDCCLLLAAELADAMVLTFDRKLQAAARALGLHVFC